MNQTEISTANQAILSSPEVVAAIDEAKSLPITDVMMPVVYQAKLRDGNTHTGVNYHRIGTPVGHKFHFDHGAGIQRNEDATIIWGSQ